MTLQTPVSNFYQNWWQSILPDVPKESEIQCSSCLMTAPPKNRVTRDLGPFLDDEKCCSFVPFLPGFAIGALLENADAELRLRLKTAFQLGTSLPLGLIPRAEKSAQVCPFFSTVNSGCTIWNYRPAVCASYHCVSSREAAGLRAWEVVEATGNELEWVLAHEVVWQLGLTEDDLKIKDASVWKTLGTPEEFYAKSWVIAQTIASETLRELVGTERIAAWNENIRRAFEL